jgi:hypothetical protein
MKNEAATVGAVGLILLLISASDSHRFYSIRIAIPISITKLMHI